MGGKKKRLELRKKNHKKTIDSSPAGEEKDSHRGKENELGGDRIDWGRPENLRGGIKREKKGDAGGGGGLQKGSERGVQMVTTVIIFLREEGKESPKKGRTKNTLACGDKGTSYAKRLKQGVKNFAAPTPKDVREKRPGRK